MVKLTITLILLSTYIFIVFFFPTPIEMASGSGIAGLLILPLAAIFYVWFISLVTVNFWKMYEYMMDVSDDTNDYINSETISLLKKVPKYIYVIVIGILFYYFYFPNESVSRKSVDNPTQHAVLESEEVNNINTKKRSSYRIKKKNPFTTEEGIIEAYGPNYDRSRDYEKEYDDRIRF